MRVLWITTTVSVFVSVLSSHIADILLEKRIPLIGDFVGLQLSYNSGFAFGMTLPEPLQTILILGALVLVGWMGWHAQTSLLQGGFGLIMGGALGNLFDRWGDSLVTDYIQVRMFSIFNVADACISIGFALLILGSLCSIEEPFSRWRRRA